MFNLFKRSQKQEVKEEKKRAVRRFIAATNSEMNKFNISFAKINAELRQDYIAMTLRARDLAKNNQSVASYINLMIRSILGNVGFKLNVTAYNPDGTSDRIANQTIEDFWYDYTKSYKKFVSACQTMNDLDFDRQILFNYLIDGEVFIHKVIDNKSKYKVRWEIIDTLSVDTLYNEFPISGNGVKIVMGIEVDEHNKPLAYYVRKDNTDYYLSGERIRIPASEIIHVYKHQFAGQLRGYTPLAPVLLNLNAVETYKRSEINASILNAVFMGMYVKTNPAADAYNDYNEDEVNDKGEIATELEANSFRFAPDGYDVKQLNSQHPNSQLPTFFKTLLKSVAGALGMSYNKLSSDYESTSYSSLRQANLEDSITVKELQQFFIDNWKNIQYATWLKYLLISDLTNLPYSKIDKFLSFDFQGRNFEYLDPAKEMQAISLRLSLGLSSPIEEIHNTGRDPVDVLNSWQKWQEMLNDRGLKMSDTTKMIQQMNNNEDAEE